MNMCKDGLSFEIIDFNCYRTVGPWLQEMSVTSGV